MKRTYFVLGCLALASVLPVTLPAQQILGTGSVGSGGFVPRLNAGQAWMGNGNWGVGIDRGAGGASGLLAVGPNLNPLTVGGFTFYVDLATALPLIPFTLSSSGGAPGMGSYFLPIPLAGINNPNLAGLTYFYQAAIFDPVAGLTLTNGLAGELTMPPLVADLGIASGPVFRFDLADPQTHAGTASGLSPVSGPEGAVFVNAGRTLYVLGSTALAKGDVSGPVPIWSVVLTTANNSGPAEGNLLLDKTRQLLWFFGDLGSGPQLNAVDINPQHATLDQVVYSTSNLGTNLVATLALSPSGTRLCVPSLLGGGIRVWDTDPSSPTFLQNIPLYQPPLPFPVTVSQIPSSFSGIWLNSKVTFSPDEDKIFVLRQGTGPTPAEIAVYSFSMQGWMDFDPTTVAVDNISPSANPPVVLGSAPASMSVNKNGSFLWVSGFGGLGSTSGGWTGRIDNPDVPGSVSFTPVSATNLLNAWRSGLNPDGTVAAVSAGSPISLRFFDTTSLVQTGNVPLSFSTSNGVVWR